MTGTRATPGGDAIQAAAKLLRDARQAICLTGAGISTDSGIPDFRSPKTGLWNQDGAKLLTEPGAMDKALNYFWAVGYKIGKKLLKARPNTAHAILARWEAAGIIKAIVTQNVDGLHQKAGSQHVIELHGNAFEARCMFCRGWYTMKRLMEMYKAAGKKAPYCIVCGGHVKPNIVLFGDPLPDLAVKDAYTEAGRADVALLIGSSSFVYPANYLPVLMHKHGGKVIVINNVPTDLDQIAEVVINGPIARILGAMEKELRTLSSSPSR